MTLSGLIVIIFIFIIIFGGIMFAIECFLIDDIENILSDFDWYNEKSRAVRHILDYCFLFLTVFVFVGFIFLIRAFISWGDTIILW